ncbi:MAG: type II toxin-antitoxin system HicB family antitoxin [Gammaproteobacteria bacterium]
MEKELKQGAERVAITAKLSAQIVKEDKGYCVYCPALNIVSQGDTVAEARANIKEAAELILEVSFARDTLHRRLKEQGFRFAGKRLPRKKRRKPLGIVVREIQFRAKVPLMAAYC